MWCSPLSRCWKIIGGVGGGGGGGEEKDARGAF